MELLGCLMANYSVGMASSCYQVPQQTWNLVGWLLSAVLFIFRKWSCMHCSDPFGLLFCFVNSRFTDCFRFPVLWHFALRLMHVPIRFGSSAVTSPGLCLIFWECLIRPFFTIQPNFVRCTLHPKVPCRKQNYSDHFPQPAPLPLCLFRQTSIQQMYW